MMFIEVLKSLRPLQWIKNFFIFAPLIFSESVMDVSRDIRAVGAFAVFCLLAGSLYILNDIKDVEEDQHHPLKSNRPIAAGRLKISQAYAAFTGISVLGFILAALINRNFFIAAALYFLLQVLYSEWLKHIVILDVFIIAIGFFIRVIAGGLAIDVYISPWLLICTILLSLFLALSKRRHELVLLNEGASGHRPILSEYSPYLLDQMIAVVTASTVMAYCLYTISDETIAKFGTRNLIFTVPFVLYGIFRYLYLIHQRSGGGSPETLIIKDRPLLLVIFLWILTAGLIIYLDPQGIGL